MTLEHNKRVASLYEPLIAPARTRIMSDERMGHILADTASKQEVLAFLIQFSALGVQMTEPVEDWIRRAGERCKELGYAELGRALVMHARHEAGHHGMMIDDLLKLVRRWNELYQPTLDAEVLLGQPPTEAMKRYVAIHEDTVTSDVPFGQTGIEYEIERMSTLLGPALMTACKRVLGDDVLAEMSFIQEHALLDVGHTAMNETELDKLLTAHPEHAERIARIGGEALNIYLDFLGDCVDSGRRLIQGPAERRTA